MKPLRLLLLATSIVLAGLVGGCSLSRAPILPPFDAGGRDALAMDSPAIDTPSLDVPEMADVPEMLDVPALDVPAMLDAPILDVPAMLDAPVLDVPAAPDVPAIPDAPRLDAPAIPDAPTVDAPDAPMLRDTPPEDAPSSCNRYAAFTGHESCPVSTPGTCRFYLNPADPRTCDDLCGFVPGSTCIAAYDVAGLRCGGVSAGTAVSCSTALDPLVCECTAVR
jgi:hypothetical protein